MNAAGDPGRAIHYEIAESSLGRLLVAGSERGLCFIRFGRDEEELEGALRAEFPCARVARNRVPIKRWSDAVVGYVDGRCARLDVPIDVGGSLFQRRVWEALRGIRRGDTASYSQIARSLGVPRGARAVARACAANPLPVVIPCHRVVPVRGGIGGYAGGAGRKRALLEREQARVR